MTIKPVEIDMIDDTFLLSKKPTVKILDAIDRFKYLIAVGVIW